ncbi:MAG: DUF732 domain-containing protein [Actinobacteria bacterium]|nr:DUF732 domain-containing protein [Actinomycetota bacterium]
MTIALVLVLGLGLAGCGSPAAPVMPDVLGKTLDVAKSDIKRVGFKDTVEVLGGGLFGILDEKNWMVCEQTPSAGDVIADNPRLVVDRSCGDEEPEPSETPAAPEPSDTPAAPEASAEPSEEASASDDDEDDSTDEDRDDRAESAMTFEEDFTDEFEGIFGYPPDQQIIDIATDFAEETCSTLDQGSTVEEILTNIVASTDNTDSQTALAIAAAVGIRHFCPEHEGQLP